SDGVFPMQFVTSGELHGLVFSSDFMRVGLRRFAIRLCAQNVHHCFLVWRKTKLEIASFDSEHVGRRSRISEKSFLRRNFCTELFPHLHRVDIGARPRRLVT